MRRSRGRRPRRSPRRFPSARVAAAKHIGDNCRCIPGVGPCSDLKTKVFLEVEGAAHYLPAYADNLDIIT